MQTGKIAAAGDHLGRMVGNRSISGLAELIWNAVDADATDIRVTIHRTDLDAVDRIVVSDNGHGFGPDEISELFSQVGGSWKHHAPNRKTRELRRILHGDKGEGRWRAFSIGDRILWESVAADADGGPNQRVEISMTRDRLDEYTWTDGTLTKEQTGTVVTVSAGTREPQALLADSAIHNLTAVLALYLTQYPDVVISYDGTPLEAEDMVTRRDELTADYANEHGPVAVTVIEWEAEVDRALYLCDENGATLHETNVGIHAPGFNFTAYIRWAGFRENESLLPLADMDNTDVGPALSAARETIRAHFKDRRAEDLKSVVQDWRDEDVYPYADDPSDPVGRAEQALFNYMAVTASDAVNRIEDKQAKKLSLAAMRIAVENDPTAIEIIFQEVLKLPDEKIEELREIIERTSLTALVDAMRLVTGRLEFLAGLELLLFDPDHAPEVLERAHLHRIIESEPWLFGEEYATHVSDQGLTALLHAHVNLLGREDLTTDPVLDEDGRRRRIDFMFGRALEFNRNRREHLVVEIKRATLIAGRDEIDQIEDYARAVAGDDRFDMETVEWNFVLVATSLDDLAEAKAQQNDRARGLVYDKDGVRVWIRKWSEIISESKHRLKFIRSQLDYDPGAEEALSYLRDRYPDYLPSQLATPETAPTSP